jgi:hypothetical protein
MQYLKSMRCRKNGHPTSQTTHAFSGSPYEHSAQGDLQARERDADC